MSMNEKEESELIFGFYDEKRYTGEMKWYPLIDELFWSIKLDDIEVGIIT